MGLVPVGMKCGPLCLHTASRPGASEMLEPNNPQLFSCWTAHSFHSSSPCNQACVCQAHGGLNESGLLHTMLSYLPAVELLFHLGTIVTGL